MKSPLYCEHANEMPAVCPCDTDCYCKSHSCFNRRRPDIEQNDQARHTKMSSQPWSCTLCGAHVDPHEEHECGYIQAKIDNAAKKAKQQCASELPLKWEELGHATQRAIDAATSKLKEQHAQELLDARKNTLDVRPEVRQFALAMEAKLKANDHKGGWVDCEFDQLFHRLEEETQELSGIAMRTWENDLVDRVVDEAADVANFAMMIADKWADFRRKNEDTMKLQQMLKD